MHNLMTLCAMIVMGCRTDSVLQPVVEKTSDPDESGNNNEQTVTVNIAGCDDGSAIVGVLGADTMGNALFSSMSPASVEVVQRGTVILEFAVSAVCADVSLADIAFVVSDDPEHWSPNYNPNMVGDATLVQTSTGTAFPEAKNAYTEGSGYFWCDNELITGDDCTYGFKSTVAANTPERYGFFVTLADTVPTDKTYYLSLAAFDWYDAGTDQLVIDSSPMQGQTIMAFTVTN